MLESQALNNVVELDIDAEIVGVELQRIVAGNGAILVHVERERGDGTVDGEAPVAVVVRVGPEVDHRPRHPSGNGAAPRCRWRAKDYMACPGLLSTEFGRQAGGHTLILGTQVENPLGLADGALDRARLSDRDFAADADLRLDTAGEIAPGRPSGLVVGGAGLGLDDDR